MERGLQQWRWREQVHCTCRPGSSRGKNQPQEPDRRGGLAKRSYVTSAGAPETAAAATFSVDGESLTQEALRIHDIYEVGKNHTRARLDQELNYSTGS
jgi:hypothetical protein